MRQKIKRFKLFENKLMSLKVYEIANMSICDIWNDGYQTGLSEAAQGIAKSSVQQVPAQKLPHPDCFMYGGCGCQNVRLDVGLNAATSGEPGAH